MDETYILANSVRYYKFSNNLSCSSTKSLSKTGTLIGSGTYTAGKIGTALTLPNVFGNTTKNYVTIPYDSDIDFVGDKCIMVFCKIDYLSTSVEGWRKTIYGLRSDIAGSPIMELDAIYISGKHSFYFGLRLNDGSYAEVLDTEPIEMNRWYHIAITRVGTLLTMYRNGAQTAQSNVGTGVATMPRGFSIGAGIGATTSEYPANTFQMYSAIYGGDNISFPGQIDDLIIFNKTITAQQISDYYNSVRLSESKYGEILPWEKVVRYYKFNGTLTDSSSSLQNGTAFDVINYQEGRIGKGICISEISPGSSDPDPLYVAAGLGTGALKIPLGNDIFYVGDKCIMCWLMPTLGRNGAVAYCVQGNFANVLLNSIGVTSNKGYFSFYSALRVNASSTIYFSISTTRIYLNKWYHIAVTRVSTAFNIYVNGVLEATTAVPSSDGTFGGTSSNHTPSIGCYNATSGDPNVSIAGACFPGYIDEFIMINATVTSKQISNYYNQCCGKFAPKMLI